VTFPPVLSYLNLHSYTENWTAGVWLKANQLRITRPDGYFRLTFEIFHKKDGLPNNAARGEPDAIRVLDLPLGSYDWREVSCPLTLPTENTGCVLIYIGNL